MILELKAHIGEDGAITLQTPVPLPTGEVDITIAYITEVDKQDEVLWDSQFAATPPEVFHALIDQGLNDYHTGNTEAFDPTQEDD